MPAASRVALSHAVAGGSTRPPNACAATERRRPHFAGAPGKPMEWSVMGLAFDRHLFVIDDHNSDERAMKGRPADAPCCGSVAPLCARSAFTQRHAGDR